MFFYNFRWARKAGLQKAEPNDFFFFIVLFGKQNRFIFGWRVIWSSASALSGKWLHLFITKWSTYDILNFSDCFYFLINVAKIQTFIDYLIFHFKELIIIYYLLWRMQQKFRLCRFRLQKLTEHLKQYFVILFLLFPTKPIVKIIILTQFIFSPLAYGPSNLRKASK